MIQKTQNTMDKTDIRPMGDYLDMFHHIYREWNQEADRLTHVAREKGATWNSYTHEAGERIEAVRCFFDGGVSSACTDKIKNRVGSAYVIQIAGQIEEDRHKMKWKTITDVAKILPNSATVTQAECTAAVDAAKAICSLARCGRICYDLDGNLIQDYRRNKTKKRHRMSEEFEGRWRMREEEISRLSRSRSSSLLVDISDSGFVEEMISKSLHTGRKTQMECS